MQPPVETPNARVVVVGEGENQYRLIERDYHCRNEMCKRTVNTLGIPIGWYIVRKSNGPNQPIKTVAYTCSLLCLIVDASAALYDKMSHRERY